MKLGFVSAILPELSLPEVMRFAGEEGFDCVELMCWPIGKAERRYAGVTHIDAANLDVAAVNKLVAETGVAISGLGYYPNLLSPDAIESETCLNHLRLVMQASRDLGIGLVNTFIGRDWTKSVEENWPKLETVWVPLAEYAAKMNLRIGIENCPMLFTSDEWPGGKNLAHSPAIWRRLFAAIPGEVIGLNFDPSHFVWQQMDYLGAMREFKERLYHIHAKDVRIDRHKLAEVGILAHPLEYHVPKLPGLGDVNWPAFFSILSDTGYNGPVCVEVEDRAYETTLDARKSALRQSARFLRQYMG